MGTGSTGVYDRLPISLQTLAITAYGINLNRRRYGKEHRRWLERLLTSQWLDAASLAENQLRSLREIVDYAAVRVPFYREAYRAVGYQPGALRELRDLESLPMVQKDEVRQNPLMFVSDEFRPNQLYRGFTSGTSGKPLETFKTRDAYQRNWAFQERVRSWFGIARRTPRVTLNARPVVPPGQSGPPFWRHDYLTNNWLFSVFHMSDANLRHYVKALVRIQPTEIHGYPSAVYELAKSVLKMGVSKIRPLAVITSSETLLAEQRVTMERAFGCSVRDQYGCAENVAWISQCEHGTYHVHPEYGYVELVADGRGVVDEPGEIVATGFINQGMPLIRYRMGDSATMARSTACACKRQFPVVRELLGRVDDTLYSVDGRPLGRLDPLFKGLANISEGQFVQERKDHLSVFLVPSGDAAGDIEILRQRIANAFGAGMRVDFPIVDRIPRSKAGKFRFQVNRMGQQDSGPETLGRGSK